MKDIWLQQDRIVALSEYVKIVLRIVTNKINNEEECNKEGASNQMKAHVICCNDKVESVFLGDEKDAEDILEKCAKTAYEESHGYHSYEYYIDIFYWHLHTVDLIKGGDTE